MNTNYIVAIIVLGVLPFWQIFLLLRFIEISNRNLKRFFESIQYSDFSTTFKGNYNDPSLRGLNSALNSVIEDFKKEREQREEQYRYLHTIVQNIGVGVIIADENGGVELINREVKQLLKLQKLTHLSQLEYVNHDMFSQIIEMKSGERSLISIKEEDYFLQISITMKEFVLHQKRYKLISLKNIRKELEDKEMDAWQSLIRVLTHEIMNSITPISSLAETANALLKEMVLCESSTLLEKKETMEDVCEAIDTIENRSKGLIHFVNNYRKLSRLPIPALKLIPVSELIYRVQNLMSPQVKQKHIQLLLNIKDVHHAQLLADPTLIEQVLINLIKNAIEALSTTKNPCIEIAAFLNNRGRIVCQVTDNGPGIKEEVLEKIFIPFFTTKEKGSGIGLNISRQIMWMHGGILTATSIQGKMTTFTLRF
ncbi:MAG: GHKL domain-containing protein [Spirochaetales bacterium]|nr:GHKL domain-containing protein [Spirochaetales bacterium]